MKKISLILLSLIFISCSNLFENILSERADAEENEQNTEQNQPESPLSQSPDSPQSPQTQEQPQNQSFVLSGSMVFDGAMPAIYSDAAEGNSRSANPALSASDVEYFVYATDSSGNKTEGSFGTGENSKTFSIGLIFGREWTITCGMRKKTGDKEEFLTASSTPKTYTVDNYTSPVVLYPVPATSGKGEVDLSMIIPPSIKMVTVSCISTNNADWTISTVSVTPGSGSTNGTAVLQTGSTDDTKIKSGVYKISLSFYKDTAGTELVFQTTQSINVFYGLKTNQWYDASATGGAVIQSDGSFVLTETHVKQYISTNFYVGTISGATIPADTNAGTHKAPFETLTRALAQIENYGNPENDYKIHISSLVFPNVDATAGFEIPASFNTKMKSLTLIGVNDNETDIIDGDNRFTVLTINTSKPVYIKKLTITEGKADNGGGIKIGSGTNVYIENCIITANEVETFGGGISSYGTVGMTSTVIKANKAKQFGYGIYIADGSFTLSSGEISGNIFVSNSTEPDIVPDSGTVFVKKSATFNFNGGTIKNNDSRAIYNHGTVNMTDGTISGHTAPRGGGIYNNGSLTISGGIITGNNATNNSDSGNGGGVYVNAPTTQTGDTPAVTPTFNMTGGTISGNTANSYGGGISNASVATISGGEISGNYITGTSNCGGGGIASFTHLTLEKDAYVPGGADGKNDIYLYDSNNGTNQFHIKIGQTLTHSNVGLLRPAVYAQSRPMVSLADGSTANLTAEAAKFNVKSESYEGDWEISSTGLLNQVPSLGKIGTTYYVNLSALLAAITEAGESETLDITLYGGLTDSQLGKAATEGTVINAIKTTAAKVNLVIDSNAQIKPTTCVQLFTGCNNLLAADLRGLDTSDITSFSYMFNGCSNLTSLDVSSFNTAKVTIMNNMFNGCKKLSSLDVSSFDTSSVINMSGMFNECEVLTSLDLSLFDTAKVTTIDQMFRNCSALTTIIVSDTFETSSVTSSSNMFSGCENLKGGANTSFSSSHLNATYAHIDEGTENPGYFTEREYYAKVNNVFYDDFASAYAAIKDATEDISVVVSDNATSAIGSATNTNSLTNAIRNTSASSVSFSVARGKTIRLTSCAYMFDGCKKLKSADLRGFDTSDVETYINFLYNCQNLESIDFSTFDTSNAKTFTCMFRECWKLKTIDLSNFDTQNVTAMNQMFRACKKTEKIIVSDLFVTTKVTSYDDIFSYLEGKLIGGAGTTWSTSLISAIGYARIDGGPSAPGLFTSNTPDQVPELSTKEVTGTTFTGSSAVSGSSVFLNKRNIGTIKTIIASDHEVTQGEYETYCDYGGGTNKPSAANGKGLFYPVYYVSWYDAIIYCNLRSKADHLDPVYMVASSTEVTDWGAAGNATDGYYAPDGCNWDVKTLGNANGWRLPYEVEWEYLARGGNLTGTQYTYSGSDSPGNVAWYRENSGGKTHPVKTDKVAGIDSKNALGLYDMSGNVFELVNDKFNSSLTSAVPLDGPDHDEDTSRQTVIKGGHRDSTISGINVSNRYFAQRAGRYVDIGFRVVRGAQFAGSKLPSEPKEVGDIVFSDGSAMAYSDYDELNADDKAALKPYAIALIFYSGTGLNDGVDTTTVRTLGVGLAHGSEQWCSSSAKAYSNNISTIQCVPEDNKDLPPYTFSSTADKNGSDNINQIAIYLKALGSSNNDTSLEGSSTSGLTAGGNYPAFFAAKDYFAQQLPDGTVFSERLFAGTGACVEGWYLPSFAELYQIYLCKTTFDLDAASTALGGATFGSSTYWSSSQDTTANCARIMAFNDGSNFAEGKISTNRICAIREF